MITVPVKSQDLSESDQEAVEVAVASELPLAEAPDRLLRDRPVRAATFPQPLAGPQTRSRAADRVAHARTLMPMSEHPTTSPYRRAS